MIDRYLTEHARQRQQQRGISALQLELLRNFGEYHYQKGGDCLCFIPEKKLSQLRSALEKISNVTMVKSGAGQVITVMHMDRKIHRTRCVA